MIELKGVTKSYGNKNLRHKVLNRINLEVGEGEMIGIIGRSGCGKTTLLNLLAGLITIEEGEYYFKEENMLLRNSRMMSKFRREHVSIIVQSSALIEDMTTYENIALPLRIEGIKKKEVRKKVDQAILDLQLENEKYLYPDELSGGQRQKVAIARAIVKSSDFILADEPTGALDEENGKMVFDVIKSLNKQGKTIVLATHDINIARKCSRIICVSQGKLEVKVAMHDCEKGCEM